MVLKYWPLIWSALVRKPAEGLQTFLAVAAGFTLLALMIGMNLTARDMLEHSRRDLLIIDTRFYDPNGGPQGLPLAIGEQVERLDGVRAVTPYRWLNGYHVDAHQGIVSTELVASGIGLALVLALLGSLPPAMRAGRLPVIQALRAQ